VRIVDALGQAAPIDDIRIGEMKRHADLALNMVKALGHWDRAYVSWQTQTQDRVEFVRPLEELQGIVVRRARELGVSWRKIGEALGMTPQGIQQKAQDRGWMVGSNADGVD
jgi:hypothetical protein